nr:MAG: ADP-ribosyltransferase [Bacteriophage sp.]
MSWNELSLKDKADYIKESVNNGIYNLSDIRNRYNMYAEGGYKPSESIKKRITNWEGSSMRTNRSFQTEANDFNRVIPSSIRSKLSQQQLDALYSYGYNVGMGKLKKRVLPTLTNYVQGKASNEDVQKSMWASKDNELRGLTTRRNIERSLFGGKYQTVFTGTGGTPHNYGYTATTNTNRSSSNPYQIQNEEWQGKNYLGAYKGLQLSMNDIMGKTKENDIDDLFSTGIGPTISMDNLLSIGNNNVAPVQPDYSYAKSLLSDFDSDLNSNMFAEGGNMDNNRTAMPAHPATNPYKRRSWETDEEYKERIQDLDNKSQEAALNDSTAINKYKEWEANIQKQQKINEEKSKVITIEKNTKRAKTLEKEFNSLRNIPSQMSPNDTIQAINKNIPEAYKQQYINNINMYKPALDTIDLGINLYSLYNPTVPVLSAGLLTNGLRFGQSIVDEDLGATDYSALAFDTLGLLGATNKLPTRLRIGKNRFWDIDKTADYLGAGQNILDSAGDVYDLSKTGYHLYNNKGSNNLYISPFEKSFDEGGNLSYIDADNRRSNILLHTEDGNLYDSAGNNYTQSYLDEEHVPIIKGTMPRNTRQYYDPNTTLEFINAATAPISNFSPSNIVGSIREARDYNTFMNSFMNQDNTGFFTREYTKEHPYISTLGNIGGDILLGTALNKGYNTFKNNINSRINKKLFNKAIDNMANISDKKLDKIYNRIYNTGDYEDLQQLRDKHFEIKASNPLMSRDKPMQLYHTVGDEYNPNFNIFNPTIEGSNSAIYTTDNLAMSKSYSSKPTYGRIKKLYSNASKSYDIEGYYQPWNEIPYNGNMWSTRTLEKAVRSHPQYGIDRLVIHNIKDWGGKAMPKGTFLMDGNIKSSGTVIENLNPNDLKYSSAVTYDDLGNIIPLSERDNFSISDLRYSLIPLGTGATLLNSKVK